MDLKTKAEYDAWWNANKPDFLPRFPEEYYSSESEENKSVLNEMNSKEKTELIKKVSGLSLYSKENKLFQKILEKGMKNWNDNDIEFLRLLYDIHHYPTLSAGGIDIYPWEQTEQIRRETKTRQENALKRLSEEPYSLWLKNLRNFKTNNK